MKIDEKREKKKAGEVEEVQDLNMLKIIWVEIKMVREMGEKLR